MNRITSNMQDLADAATLITKVQKDIDDVTETLEDSRRTLVSIKRLLDIEHDARSIKYVCVDIDPDSKSSVVPGEWIIGRNALAKRLGVTDRAIHFARKSAIEKYDADEDMDWAPGRFRVKGAWFMAEEDFYKCVSKPIWVTLHEFDPDQPDDDPAQSAPA